MGKYVVYMHVSPTMKRYIGITCQDPKKRWCNGKGYKNNKHFFNAVQKYGWESFEHLILFEGLTKEEACEKEQELIKKYNSHNPHYGYNGTKGGEHYEFSEDVIDRLRRPKNISDETRNDMRERARIIYEKYLRGRKATPEQIRKISEALKGKKQPSEFCKKRGDSIRKVYEERGGFSDEHKKKISEALTGRTYSDDTIQKFREAKAPDKNPRSRKVVQKDFSGNVIRTYASTREAMRETGIEYSSIVRVCNKRLNHAGGYCWEYVS